MTTKKKTKKKVAKKTTATPRKLKILLSKIEISQEIESLWEAIERLREDLEKVHS